MDKLIYTNLKLCTAKGARLAIYARHINKGTEIFTLKCSKQDDFSKKKACEVYEKYAETGSATDYHPTIDFITNAELNAFDIHQQIKKLGYKKFITFKEKPKVDFHYYDKPGWHKRLLRERNSLNELLKAF